MQLSSPLLEPPEPLVAKDRAAFSDPSFASNKLLPVHRWVPWIAGFSSSFVSNILAEKLNFPGTVLDPFAGVGTTLVEALLAGHNAMGFEINPYAAFACEIKINSHKLNSPTIREAIAQLESFYNSKISSNYLPESKPPVGLFPANLFTV